jgi:hypothetical protein
MFTLGGSPAEVVACINGFAVGIQESTGRDPLQGFDAWCAGRFGYPENRHWSGLVRNELRRDDPRESLIALSALLTEWAAPADSAG